MEHYTPISYLNDFIFCPRSIYFHKLYGSYNHSLYKGKAQTSGTEAHRSIDEKNYSSRKNILQGVDVYSEKYKLYGKVDIFEKDTGKIRERKNNIKGIYDGYVFQVYAHYYALTEMGYLVKSIELYDITKNKKYPIDLPEDNPAMKEKFNILIESLNTYDILKDKQIPYEIKCKSCIYSQLCDRVIC